MARTPLPDATHARPHLAALTGLRGAAAVWVLVYHLFKSFAGDGAGLIGNYALPGVREGFRGVDLFFVLSGFVMAYVHLDALARPERGAVLDYARRRAWRIYPLNVAWQLATVALVLLAPAIAEGQVRYRPELFSWQALVAALTLTQTWFGGLGLAWNAPAWTLSAELAAYASLPLIAPLLARVRSPWHCAAVAVVSLVLLVAVLAMAGRLTGNPGGGLGLARALGGFVAGAALYRLVALRPVGRAEARALAAAGATLALAGCAARELNWLWLGAAPLLVLAATRADGATGRLLAAEPLVRLGRVSFSLYICHWPVILWLRAELVARGDALGVVDGVALVIVAITLVVLLTQLSWRFVEQPSHALARRLNAPRPAPAPALRWAEPTRRA